MSNEETASPREPDQPVQPAATTVASRDPADARQHLAARCEELAAARRRWKALREAAEACRRAKEDASDELAELDDAVESVIQANRDRAHRDAIRAKKKANEALNTVESFGWRHRLRGNPYALWGMLLAIGGAASQYLIILLFRDSWSDSPVRYLTVVVLIAALILSRRGWARSYKRGKLPQKGEGVLPLRGAATTGRWVSAFPLISGAAPIAVDIYGAFLRVTLNHELGDDYAGSLLPDALANVFLSASFPFLVVTGAVLASAGASPTDNTAYEYARNVVTAITGVGRWAWRRLRRRRAQAPEATKPPAENPPAS